MILAAVSLKGLTLFVSFSMMSWLMALLSFLSFVFSSSAIGSLPQYSLVQIALHFSARI